VYDAGTVVGSQGDFILVQFADGYIGYYFGWRFDPFPKLGDNVTGNYLHWKVIGRQEISWQECGF
jgi:hypothetical protein